jgi:hypothetical protein
VKLYIPSWNGDFRLEDAGDGKTKLVVHKPTAQEQKIVGEFLRRAGLKGWVDDRDREVRFGDGDRGEVTIAAPLSAASKVLIRLTRPKKQTLTAVSFSDGKLSVIEGADEAAIEKIGDAIAKATATETPKEPAKGASVRRPTPCCPDCEIGSVEPASEVLLSFLNEAEHETWSRERAIVVTGGLTGHRYILAHRRSPIAAYNTKICFDLDDGQILHFHDNSVPPEEEVLAAKLILEHREPWLRNEATLLHGENMKFKNPFGGLSDGTETAAFVSEIGRVIRGTKAQRSIMVDSPAPWLGPRLGAKCDGCGVNCDVADDLIAPGLHLCKRCKESATPAVAS